MSLWLDNVSLHSYMRLGPVLLPAPSCVSPDYRHVNVHVCVLLLSHFDSLWRLLPVHVDVMHLCFGDVWQSLQSLPVPWVFQIPVKNLIHHTPLCCCKRSWEWVTLCTSTRCSWIWCTGTSISVGHWRTCWTQLGLLIDFLFKSAELARQLSASRYSAHISSVRVTRFLFPPSQNPSDVAFKLLTMLTFLNTVSFLIVSPSNFAISSSRPSLHTYWPQLASWGIHCRRRRLWKLCGLRHHTRLLLRLLHFFLMWRRHVTSLLLDVGRSLSMPWKSQRLAQQLSSSVSVSFSGLKHWGSEPWRLFFIQLLTVTIDARLVQLHSPISRTASVRSSLYKLNCWHLSHSVVITRIIQCALDLMVWCPSSGQWIASDALWQSSFASSITHRCCLILLHGILINTFAGAWGTLLYNLVVRDTLLVKLVVDRALLTDRSVHATLLVDEVVLGALVKLVVILSSSLCSSIVLVVL